MDKSEPIPASLFRDLELFDAQNPPAVGTKVMVLEHDMIASYGGRNAKGEHVFAHIYADVRVNPADLIPGPART